MLEMLNPILGNLTPKEIKIVVYILDNRLHKLDKDNRTSIRMYLDMDKFNFNNYLSKLKAKKILSSDGKLLILNPKITHILNQNSLTVNFI